MSVMCSTSRIACQVPQATFHVYVDPIQGDDAQAAARNPNGTVSALHPLDGHPAGATVITGVIQHAPYNFRTVHAAVQYLGTWPSPPPGGPAHFYENPSDPQNKWIYHVVIHCMPGLYGPRSPSANPNDDDFDPRSGLPWNGEVLPIALPGLVSIQGTSALDTIFDARGYETWGPSVGQDIFRFATGTGTQRLHAESFIDSITMRGCRVGTGIRDGAAVLIDSPTDAVDVKITNCFIYGNDIGIAMFSRDANHRPWIVNNTIAWNQIGIYSGDLNPAGPHVGGSEPIIHNNIIDPIRLLDPALPPYLLGVGALAFEPPSCFEGLAAADVTSVAVNMASCTTPTCWNAYLETAINLGNGWPYGATTPRDPAPFLPPVILMSMFGAWNGGNPIRGDLYIRDVLHTAGKTCAPHDFRLSPRVRLANGGFSLNPLVNAALMPPQWSVGQRIEFANINLPVAGIQSIQGPIGIAPDSLARFDDSDWDCEGVGNPRDQQRRAGVITLGGVNTWFGHPEHGCGSLRDLGADELGEVIITGFIDSTRAFSRPHASIAANTAQIADCSTFYFMNVYQAPPIGPLQFISPQLNARADNPDWPIVTSVPLPPPNASPGTGSQWFAQLGPFHNPYIVPSGLLADPPIPFAFTSGQHFDPYAYASLDTTRFLLIKAPAGTAYSHFMRTRACDIGSHILFDIDTWNPNVNSRDVDYAEYEFWWQSAGATQLHDIFQNNPWVDMADTGQFPARNDNRFLYIDGAQQTLREGTLEPPLTIFKDPILGPLVPKS